VETIRSLYDQGQRIFGENKVQELLEKKPLLPADIQWHLIGHLQTNKVRAILPHVDCIQSVDSVRLLRLLEKECQQHELHCNILIQVKISGEATKYGFDPDTVIEEIRRANPSAFSGVRFCGVMGMASFTSDTDLLRKEFGLLRQIFQQLQSDVFSSHATFRHISMGMSGDYPLAIEEGSTMVRIGSLLFGKRE
jgi:pyridoxal phosphate enzyme (YggS family)